MGKGNQANSTFPQRSTTQLISAMLDRMIQPFKPLSTRSRTLMLAAGFSISMTIPVYAATTLHDRPIATKPQQISQNPKTIELTLVSFAVTKEAYSKIIPQFQEKWKREKGQEVKFSESYGGSGSQTRAVIDGLEADVVALALALDTNRIQKAGLINPGWEKEVPNEGIVTRSVIALVTRPGNPKGIKGWADLVKPGIQVITANPKTSGVARWNFLGLWGSVIQTGGSEQQARDFVGQVYRNAPLLTKDAREATDIFFKKGQGDVLLNYENEMILAAQKGETGFFTVIPQNNISIDNPIAVVDKYVDKRGTREAAEAFVKFLFTPEAQREFAKVGFRPVDLTVRREFAKKFAPVKNLYTVKNFNGWDAIQSRFFADNGVFDQIYTAQR